jgi:two-component system nitrogen regulation response regulator NtrX
MKNEAQDDILIVDDQPDIRELIQGLLEDEGMACRSAASSQDAVRMMDEKHPTVVILDIWLEESDMDGMALLKKIVKAHPDTPVIMISGHGNIETAVSAIQMGAYDFIEKPFKADRVIVLAQRALEAARLKRENRELKMMTQAAAVQDLHGNSPKIDIVRQAIQRVAPTNSRVLITGAPGTGKDVAARMIHNLSRRADKNLVILSCATLSSDRIDAELFGAAGKQRVIGALERANGGTLVLDEVADMPLETQSKIVRVLQDQSFLRGGDQARIDLDLRVIATTNQDLKLLISQSQFREDLYYRLNVVPIEMPLLSERLSDIADLADLFMSQTSKQANVAPRQFAEDAVALMQAYEWPGNVRQLRNAVEWLLIMAGGDASQPITADMLPPEIKKQAIDMIRGKEGVEIMSKPLREAREIFERDYLLSQVKRFGGNISRTALFIGMERSALHRKLKSLGVYDTDDTDADTRKEEATA